MFDKDRKGKYDVTLNEVDSTVSPTVIEEQDSEDTAMPKSITMK